MIRRLLRTAHRKACADAVSRTELADPVRRIANKGSCVCLIEGCCPRHRLTPTSPPTVCMQREPIAERASRSPLLLLCISRLPAGCHETAQTAPLCEDMEGERIEEGLLAPTASRVASKRTPICPSKQTERQCSARQPTRVWRASLQEKRKSSCLLQPMH
jgi:hypothetical protein